MSRSGETADIHFNEYVPENNKKTECCKVTFFPIQADFFEKAALKGGRVVPERSRRVGVWPSPAIDYITYLDVLKVIFLDILFKNINFIKNLFLVSQVYYLKENE